MSAAPIAMGVVQVGSDILKGSGWLWHRRSPQARYQMYTVNVVKLETLNGLTAAQQVVVNMEKKRIYLKMLKLWGNDENLRNTNQLNGLLRNMAAAGVRQGDLEQADLNAVIAGLDAELGNGRGAQALLNAGL